MWPSDGICNRLTKASRGLTESQRTHLEVVFYGPRYIIHYLQHIIMLMQLRSCYITLSRQSLPPLRGETGTYVGWWGEVAQKPNTHANGNHGDWTQLHRMAKLKGGTGRGLAWRATGDNGEGEGKQCCRGESLNHPLGVHRGKMMISHTPWFCQIMRCG